MARKTKEEAQQTRQHIIDAARKVFHQHGVARSTLEQVATAAGLTRGAVYWHFKDKVELFQAMRADVFDPLSQRIETLLNSEEFSDPLDAIEAALKEVFLVLDQCPTVREMLEIMILRCECANEFAEVQIEAERPGEEFLEQITAAYREAAAKGTLRPGLDPEAVALDSWAFMGGLMHGLIARNFEWTRKPQLNAVIAAHMALRRVG